MATRRSEPLGMWPPGPRRSGPTDTGALMVLRTAGLARDIDARSVLQSPTCSSQCAGHPALDVERLTAHAGVRCRGRSPSGGSLVSDDGYSAGGTEPVRTVWTTTIVGVPGPVILSSTVCGSGATTSLLPP